jgi:hypothetical protein
VGCWHTITGPENRDAKRQSPPSGPANSLEAGLHDTRNHPEPAEPLRLGLTFSTSCQRITAAGALQELSLECSSVSSISRACHCEQILMGYTPQVTPPPSGGGDTLSHFSDSHSWSQSADGHGNAPPRGEVTPLSCSLCITKFNERAPPIVAPTLSPIVQIHCTCTYHAKSRHPGPSENGRVSIRCPAVCVTPLTALHCRVRTP